MKPPLSDALQPIDQLRGCNDGSPGPSPTLKRPWNQSTTSHPHKTVWHPPNGWAYSQLTTNLLFSSACKIQLPSAGNMMSHLRRHEAFFYNVKLTYSWLSLLMADRALPHLQNKYIPLNFWKILAYRRRTGLIFISVCSSSINKSLFIRAFSFQTQHKFISAEKANIWKIFNDFILWISGHREEMENKYILLITSVYG